MFSWHAIPFVRLLVPFILGIFISLYCPVGFVLPIVLLFFSLALYLLYTSSRSSNHLFREQKYVGVLITMVMLCLGYLRTHGYDEQAQPKHFTTFSKSKFLEIVVDDGVTEKNKFYRCYAKVIGVVDSNRKFMRAQGSLLFYLKKGQGIIKPAIGSHFWVNSKYIAVKPPSNPEEFDYKRYLSSHNISSQLFADSSSHRISKIYTVSIFQYANKWRNHVLKIIKTNIQSAKEAGVAEALLMGYKDDLDPDITSAFMRTGTLHVLAVSGMHAGIIYLVLALFTAPLRKFKGGKLLQVIILLLGIWFYAFMTGLSSSVLRASIMFSFISIGKLLRYQVNIYNNIYASAFLLLAYNPKFIIDIGFQLSYLAVLGIVFIQPLIQNWYKPRFWIDKYLWGLISVSLAAQLLTFPIGIFYFHQFPNYFILSNLLIIPITSLILIGLIILVVLSFIPSIAIIFGSIILYLLQFSNWLVTQIDRLPYSYVGGLYIDTMQMLAIYLIIILILMFHINRYKSVLLYLPLIVILFYSNILYEKYIHDSQRIIVVHHIKSHNVYSFIDGTTVYLFSDSVFLNNEAGIKFFLEPFYWKQGITRIKKCNLKNSVKASPVFYDKNVGFQFYDRFLTIDKILKENVHKNGILIVNRYHKGLVANMTIPPKLSKYGASISFFDKRNFERDYFKKFASSYKSAEHFILLSF